MAEHSGRLGCRKHTGEESARDQDVAGEDALSKNETQACAEVLGGPCL